MLTLTGHTDNVASVSFSPDGMRLASVSADGTVKVWDARPWTPELRAQFQARGLLTVKRGRVKSLEELQAVIRSDKTINELVRKQALDWAELFWKNSRVARDQQAIDIARKLAEADPADAQAQRVLIVSHAKFGLTHRKLMDYSASVSSFQAGLNIAMDVQKRGLLKDSIEPLIEALKRDLATSTLQQATGDWKTVVELAKKTPMLLYHRAAEFAKQQKFDEATQAAAKYREMAQTATDGKADMLYNAACAYGLCDGRCRRTWRVSMSFRNDLLLSVRRDPGTLSPDPCRTGDFCATRPLLDGVSVSGFQARLRSRIESRGVVSSTDTTDFSVRRKPFNWRRT